MKTSGGRYYMVCWLGNTRKAYKTPGDSCGISVNTGVKFNLVFLFVYFCMLVFWEKILIDPIKISEEMVLNP